jgi:hypothetical protein
MHGRAFAENIRPVLARLHSSLGRQPRAKALQALRDRFSDDASLRTIWEEYEITSSLLPNACTIASAIGTFHYETLTLPVSDSHAIVVQVPDDASRERLVAAGARA